MESLDDDKVYISSVKVGKGSGEINLACHLGRCSGLGCVTPSRDPDTRYKVECSAFSRYSSVETWETNGMFQAFSVEVRVRCATWDLDWVSKLLHCDAEDEVLCLKCIFSYQCVMFYCIH